MGGAGGGRSTGRRRAAGAGAGAPQRRPWAWRDGAEGGEGRGDPVEGTGAFARVAGAGIDRAQGRESADSRCAWHCP